MDDLQASNPNYPTLHFLVRYGEWVVTIVALVPIVLGGWAVSAGWSYLYAVAGVSAGAFLYLVLRALVELIRVIVDMLLPK